MFAFWSTCFVDHYQFTQAYLISVLNRLRLPGNQALLVNYSSVHTFQVFNAGITTPHHKLSVLTPYTFLLGA
jgi:hypothetical protein